MYQEGVGLRRHSSVNYEGRARCCHVSPFIVSILFTSFEQSPQRHVGCVEQLLICPAAVFFEREGVGAHRSCLPQHNVGVGIGSDLPSGKARTEWAYHTLRNLQPLLGF